MNEKGRKRPEIFMNTAFDSFCKKFRFRTVRMAIRKKQREKYGRFSFEQIKNPSSNRRKILFKRFMKPFYFFFGNRCSMGSCTGRRMTAAS